MSPSRARMVANVLLIAGASVAAFVITSRPQLRRAVWNLSRPTLARLPDYLRREVSTAWMRSGRRS